MIVIGRGLGLAIAQEAALKLKETSGIQAEAFSSAEVRHGPMELIDRDYPLLVFAPRGPEQAGLIQLARDMRTRMRDTLQAGPSGEWTPTVRNSALAGGGLLALYALSRRSPLAWMLAQCAITK